METPQTSSSLSPASLRSLEGKILLKRRHRNDFKPDRTITGKSNSFIVFPGSSSSSVGLLRKTSIALQYDGPFQVVQGIVDAFNVS